MRGLSRFDSSAAFLVVGTGGSTCPSVVRTRRSSLPATVLRPSQTSTSASKSGMGTTASQGMRSEATTPTVRRFGRLKCACRAVLNETVDPSHHRPWHGPCETVRHGPDVSVVSCMCCCLRNDNTTKAAIFTSCPKDGEAGASCMCHSSQACCCQAYNIYYIFTYIIL